jgi:hypothetical protein
MLTVLMAGIWKLQICGCLEYHEVHMKFHENPAEFSRFIRKNKLMDGRTQENDCSISS